MFIECTFSSQCLLRKVTYQAYLPDNGIDKHTKVLIVLHGIGDCNKDWMMNTKIIPMIEKQNTILIFPNGENSFYVNQHESKRFADFIGKELIEHFVKLFHVNAEKQSWFILGNSMGGYGALHIGWLYASQFQKIIALSPALIIENAINSTEDAPFIIERKSFFSSIFGDLEQLSGSIYDINSLILKRKNEGNFVDMYIGCGTQDFLIDDNKKFHQFLQENDINHKYVEHKGTHDWKYWDNELENAFKWLYEK